MTSLPQNETLVLLAIADRADDDGNAFPGIKEIALKSRMSPRNVTRVLSRLEDKKLLSVNREKCTKTPWLHNTYKIICGVLTDCQGVLTDCQGVVTDCQGVVTDCQGGTDTAVSDDSSYREEEEEKMTLSLFSVFYQKTFGKMMPGLLNQEARTFCSKYPSDVLQEAFRITAERGGTSFSYLKKVIEGRNSNSNTPTSCSTAPQRGTLEELRAKGIDV